MREINLNGYIDDALLFGDEITPEALHEALYDGDIDPAEDVHIRLNSYGGSCNAAVRMHDDIRAYAGKVNITISGTAASAATVLAMAADNLEITPGSLFMIHDPSTLAYGIERDLNDAIALLRACKDSILNVYGKRCTLARDVVAAMMTATTWMDATAAQHYGFVDSIVDAGAQTTNRVENRAEAEKKVKAWFERHKPVGLDSQNTSSTEDSVVKPARQPVEVVKTTPPPEDSGPEELGTTAQPESTGTPIAQLRTRLGLIMPHEAKQKEELNHE